MHKEVVRDTWIKRDKEVWKGEDHMQDLPWTTKVLATIARLVPSEVVVKSRSGFSSNFKIDRAAEFPSSASCFIFIRFTETMPISEPEKNASISIPRNTSMRVVAKSISRSEPYRVPFQTMEGKEGSKG